MPDVRKQTLTQAEMPAAFSKSCHECSTGIPFWPVLDSTGTLSQFQTESNPTAFCNIGGSFYLHSASIFVLQKAWKMISQLSVAVGNETILRCLCLGQNDDPLTFDSKWRNGVLLLAAKQEHGNNVQDTTMGASVQDFFCSKLR